MDADAPALHPELVPIASLTLDPKNARIHDERNLSVIGYSLGKFQQVKPIVVHRRTKIIIAGNGTVTQALEMGAEAIVAVWVDKVRVDGVLRDMTDEEAAELALLDNRSAELAEWDVAVLAEQIGEMPDLDWAAAGWEAPDFEGFEVDWPIADVAEVGEHDRELGSDGEADEVEEPPIPEVPADPVTQLGEVIQLGPHVLHCADCMEVMAAMPDNSVDFIGTDGPYGLSPDGKARTWDEIEVLRAEGKGPKSGFMGKAWDAGVPGLKWARECLRILKPGGHLVSFSATRTYHRHACAVEDVGFEIRDMFDWLQWQGFPKSLNVSAAVDEAMGREREVVGENLGTKPRRSAVHEESVALGDGWHAEMGPNGGMPVTGPASDLAATWDGFGTALKSAKEPAVVARKPLDNIAPVEVAELLGQPHMWNRKALDSDDKREAAAKRWTVEIPEGAVEWRGRPLLPDVEGRLELRVGDEVIASQAGQKYSKAAITTVATNVLKWGTGAINIDAGRFEKGDLAWPGPQDEWDVPNPKPEASFFPGASGRSGEGRSESRSTLHDLGRWPANIYATPKPATSERNEVVDLEPPTGDVRADGGAQHTIGVAKQPNHHPTVKPRKLFSQLLRLFCPPGGTAFEPFGGSGTTLVAACGLDCKVIATEREPGYCDIIRARVEWALSPEAQPTGSPQRKAGKPRTKARDGDKRQARRRVQTLIQNGTLPKACDVICVDCEEAPGREYDHHLGYGAAHHEDVEALCASCHHKREAERAKVIAGSAEQPLAD